MMGSKTIPALFERGSPSTTASGVRIPRPRPRKRARSLSYCGVSYASPSSAIRWASQTRGSSADRGRREASRVPSSGTNSVSTKSFENAGWAGVGRDIDLTVPVFQIGDRQPAELGVVLRGDHDLEGGRHRPMPLHDLGPVLGVDDVVGVRFGSAGLEAGGPHVTGICVPQEDERAPVVTNRILSPTGDGKIAPS
jgi:hypothetical protein